MKVLISDNLAPEGIEVLKKRGIDFEIKTGLSSEELSREIKNYEGIIIRSGTKLKADIINVATNLKIIGRAGVGLDNVDLEAATKKGIIVMNAPSGNTMSTAEHTMALILSLSRNIYQAGKSIREKKWERKKFMGVELYKKVLGIVGLGRIGREVAKRALGFGMKVIAFDPYISKDLADNMALELVDYDTLLKNSDYITFHVPLAESTYHIFGEKEISLVKDTVRVINCSRGGVLDEEALYNALKDKKISGAALDVYEKEPPQDSPLLELDNVVLTPHLGASTEEAQVNVAVEIAEQVSDVLLGKAIRNAVNLPSLEPEALKNIGPYLNLSEKLGLLLGQLIEGAAENIVVKYSGDILEQETSPITAALIKGFLTPILVESVNYVNAPVIAKERGMKIEEIKTSAVKNFTNLIKVSVQTSKGEIKVAGTLFTKENPKIVDINGFYLEAVPSGFMAIISNDDKPGVIGHIGTTLGKKGINIAGMTFGRKAPGNAALTVLNVESALNDSVVKELLSFEHIKDVKLIKL